MSETELLTRQAKAAVAGGAASYRDFFAALPGGKKRWLVDHGHEEFKMDAEQADADAAQPTEGEDV